MIKTVYPAGAGTLNSAAAAFNSVRFIRWRGNTKNILGDKRFSRFIPAGAGNTLHYTQETPQTAVYPLARGTLYRMMCGDYSTGLSAGAGTR
ncbi:hypothetical protein IVW58_06490 [Salmonella enterica subsp. enterica serovar Worthington]|nr:hypothetical protein [Salmonella enterica subsp. enterica serovar Worthington]